jgi:hypothetical protein
MDAIPSVTPGQDGVMSREAVVDYKADTILDVSF